MPATLSIVDNADGTGATATIADSAGAQNSVFAARWDGGFTAAEWVLSGTRVGDGTVTLDSLGYHWAYLLSGSDLTSILNYRATSGDAAIWDQLLDAVVTKLKAMSLTGITTANIDKQKLPWNLERITEGVYVSPVRETSSEANNIKDDVRYGVQITMFSASNKDLTTNLDRLLLWRQEISWAFRSQAMPGMLAQVFDVTLEPGPVIDIGAWKEQFDASTLVLRCRSRESRGAA
jgi:hypothetical protein